MRPPFEITPEILAWTAKIAQSCGLLEGLKFNLPQPELRRGNRIRAIQGSLAVEGNTLSLDQVTAVLAGKRVSGPRRDILEAANAGRAYDLLGGLDPFSERDFLRAHGVLMDGLDADAGRWRRGNVGIQKGKSISHLAPPPARVPGLMKELFRFMRREKRIPLDILSCVFHYESAFIHPFMDGNGRMARLWQSALLGRYHPAFAFVPVESMVKRHQRNYYKALEAAKAALARDWFSRKDHLLLSKTISSATASRDLKEGVDSGLLEKRGDRAATRYRFKRPGQGA
jgi:Fic family protein